ncbi:hypothetical protein FRB96_002228 [Tulasnella sp. 330]|nr:hypothetical protein FRB96_002228 [Tulasnella sp. 330]KAG8875969.1 hypothetical protein FRB97_004550 [Tulasnella sp. 331]KAG8881425.1 hypothetical protein FRB98_004360 [Tulasnella sp. 332]
MSDIGWPIRAASQLLTSSGGGTVPGDPGDDNIVYVSLWQERDIWAHNYVVVEAETRATTPAERIFVRAKRDKARWGGSSGGSPVKEIMTSRPKHTLTTNSFQLIFFTVDVDLTP